MFVKIFFPTILFVFVYLKGKSLVLTRYALPHLSNFEVLV